MIVLSLTLFRVVVVLVVSSGILEERVCRRLLFLVPTMLDASFVLRQGKNATGSIIITFGYRSFLYLSTHKML